MDIQALSLCNSAWGSIIIKQNDSPQMEPKTLIIKSWTDNFISGFTCCAASPLIFFPPLSWSFSMWSLFFFFFALLRARRVNYTDMFWFVVCPRRVASGECGTTPSENSRSRLSWPETSTAPHHSTEVCSDFSVLLISSSFQNKSSVSSLFTSQAKPFLKDSSNKRKQRITSSKQKIIIFNYQLRFRNLI